MIADAFQIAIEKPTLEGMVTTIIFVFLSASALIWFILRKRK